MHAYWYKEAIIYSLDVRSFKDSNGDGIGDLKGLIEKFDHIVSLGINCIWLTPFYLSKGRDFGYDVMDYFKIDPQLGTLEEFQSLIEIAKANNIKIILDLVVNHTSDEHQWFQEARKNKDSPYYNYYIWAKERPSNHDQDVIFKPVEDSNWEYDDLAKEYYYHTFYHFQPDLNISNPEVQKEIIRIIDFWMQQGIAGFRMDAVPHLVRKKGVDKTLEDSFHVLDSFKQIVTNYQTEGIIVGEADVEPEEYLEYFEGRRLDGIFNFYCNNYVFYALAANDPQPLIEAFQRLPQPPEYECYLNFLRNHDELDLERLSNEQREQVYQRFAPEEDMRIYGRGIRRRFAPMMDNNIDIIKFGYSLLLSLPGTPVLRYGQEIGMGDDLTLKERNSVRTTMQWNSETYGGFSSSPPTEKSWPVIDDGPNSFKKINVEDQQADKDSLLSSLKEMIKKKHEAVAFGHGRFENVETGNPKVMAHCCRYEGQIAFAIHNFSNEQVSVHLNIPDSDPDSFSLIISKTCSFEVSDKGLDISLKGYGFGWWTGGQNTV